MYLTDAAHNNISNEGALALAEIPALKKLYMSTNLSYAAKNGITK